MRKNYHYKKEIEFKIGEGNVDALMKLADSPEGEEFGFYAFEDAPDKTVSLDRSTHSIATLSSPRLVLTKMPEPYPVVRNRENSVIAIISAARLAVRL